MDDEDILEQVDEGDEGETGEEAGALPTLTWACPNCGKGYIYYSSATRHRRRSRHGKPVLVNVDTGEIITTNPRKAPIPNVEAQYISLDKGGVRVSQEDLVEATQPSRSATPARRIGPRIPVRFIATSAEVDGRVLTLYDAFRRTNPDYQGDLGDFLTGCVALAALEHPEVFGLEDVVKETLGIGQ